MGRSQEWGMRAAARGHDTHTNKHHHRCRRWLYIQPWTDKHKVSKASGEGAYVRRVFFWGSESAIKEGATTAKRQAGKQGINTRHSDTPTSYPTLRYPCTEHQQQQQQQQHHQQPQRAKSFPRRKIGEQQQQQLGEEGEGREHQQQQQQSVSL